MVRKQKKHILNTKGSVFPETKNAFALPCFWRAYDGGKDENTKFWILTLRNVNVQRFSAANIL